MSAALQIDKQPALDLMQQALRGNGQLADEYPLVFGNQCPGAIVALEEDGEILSSCAILERELVIDDQTLSAGLIGSVVTAPHARHQGHARTVLDKACTILADKGAAIAWLWANDPEVYASMGWSLSGAELVYLIHPEQQAFLPDPIGVRPYDAQDLEQVYSLYQKHTARVNRSKEEMEALINVPGMTVLVQEQDGSVLGYACVGKGEDLQQVLHEWGGECPSVLALLNAHLELREDEDDGSLYMMIPPCNTGIVDYFDITRAEGLIGVLGLAKVINREKVGEIIRRNFARDIKVEVTPTMTNLSRGSHRISLDDDDLLKVILAPKGDRTLVSKIERRLRADATNLPLLPFIWGLDSI